MSYFWQGVALMVSGSSFGAGITLFAARWIFKESLREERRLRSERLRREEATLKLQGAWGTPNQIPAKLVAETDATKIDSNPDHSRRALDRMDAAKRAAITGETAVIAAQPKAWTDVTVATPLTWERPFAGSHRQPSASPLAEVRASLTCTDGQYVVDSVEKVTNTDLVSLRAIRDFEPSEA